MELHKQSAHDVTATNRRSSLKRLGSLTSLALPPTLQIFHRRRSNIAADSAIDLSTSNNVSSPSTISRISDSDTVLPSTPSPMIELKTDEVAGSTSFPEPYSTRRIERRSVGSLPKSRTYSQLPVVSRKNIPDSATITTRSQKYPPPSRLPSPPGTTRKYSITTLLPASMNKSLNKRKLPRSGTEPLFNRAVRRDSPIDEHQQMKENISFGPVRRVTPLAADFSKCDSQHIPSSQQSNYDRTIRRHARIIEGWDAPENLTALPRATTHSNLPSQVSFRNIVDRVPSSSIKSRPLAPGARQKAQRWASQPTFINSTTNHIRSFKAQIKQARLLGEVEVPTPSVSSVPSVPPGSADSKRLSLCNYPSVSAPTQQAPTRTRASTLAFLPQPLTLTPILPPPPLPPTTHHKNPIFIPKSPAYWTGRFSAVNDRLRNEELTRILADNDITNSPTTISSFDSSTTENTLSSGFGSDFDTPAPMTKNSQRMRQAVEELASLCVTSAAQNAFRQWQGLLVEEFRVQELGRSVVDAGWLNLDTEEERGNGKREEGEKKAGLIGRLFGRGRRSIGVAE